MIDSLCLERLVISDAAKKPKKREKTMSSKTTNGVRVCESDTEKKKKSTRAN